MTVGRGRPDGGVEQPRFPGFDVMGQARHWDDATRAVVVGRTVALPPVRFFSPAEEAVATPLLDRLLGQRAKAPGQRIDLVRMVDSRLAEDQTDGWHFDAMPSDEVAWRRSLAGLDEDAAARFGTGFAECRREEQDALIEAIRTSAAQRWHGMPPGAVWSLWTRYAATAFYSHPAAWNEIGFSGPAYPRGYKNLGVDRLESYEVRDAEPGDDPLRGRP